MDPLCSQHVLSQFCENIFKLSFLEIITWYFKHVCGKRSFIKLLPFGTKISFFSHITGQSKFTRMQKNMHMLLRARTVKREV